MDTLFATTKPHYINVKKVDVTEISHIHLTWLREPDLNRRPSGYECQILNFAGFCKLK